MMYYARKNFMYFHLTLISHVTHTVQHLLNLFFSYPPRVRPASKGLGLSNVLLWLRRNFVTDQLLFPIPNANQ